MGKANNAMLWQYYDDTLTAGLDEAFGDEPVLTPEQIEQIEADDLERLHMDRMYAVQRYAVPVGHIRLGDEAGAWR
ncbi:hypothetical protein [Paraburkholderia sp.]|uniref:hypothetical protein n=1 Tax=Paraburkholderia sp. TaxID=1926495 RepID=UPI00238A0932|nr:hypothetical protein [Paraburkholderia sp.]MDE1179459.1 hypothetical protein [Paraburkholderia sp.]